MTGGYKARHIGGILRTVARLVRFARHNIWNCRRERWQAPRLNGSRFLSRCSPRTIAYCANARKSGFDVGRRRRSISTDAAGDLARLIFYGRDKISRRVRAAPTKSFAFLARVKKTPLRTHFFASRRLIIIEKCFHCA